jgi:hypothetical protein
MKLSSLIFWLKMVATFALVATGLMVLWMPDTLLFIVNLDTEELTMLWIMGPLPKLLGCLLFWACGFGLAFENAQQSLAEHTS